MSTNEISSEQRRPCIMFCVIWFGRELRAVILGLACSLFCGLYSLDFPFGPFTVGSSASVLRTEINVGQ